MTAVTLVSNIPTYSPSVEKVIVTATDDYTYKSRKFGKQVLAVSGAFQSDQGSLSIPLSFAISGTTVTVHCTGLSAKNILLELTGN